MSELRECPFCQSTNLFVKYESWSISAGLNFVICNGCGCKGPFSFKSIEEARELWNQRKGASTQGGPGDELGCRYCRECDVFCPTLNGKGASE